MTDTKEKLVELIGQVQDEGCDYSNCLDRYDKPDYIENSTLADHLIANGVRLEDKQATSNGWIPVTERLPDQEFWEHQNRFEDEDLEVQVMIKGARRPTTLLYNAEGEFYEQHSDGATFYIVTHWAPLLEPPQQPAEEANHEQS